MAFILVAFCTIISIDIILNYPYLFLAREAELRQLRKSNTDYEQQNAILQKHIENMKAAVEKLEVETMQQRNNNVALQQHLDHMRATLTASFQNIPLPGIYNIISFKPISRKHILLILDSMIYHIYSIIIHIKSNMHPKFENIKKKKKNADKFNMHLHEY